MIAGTARIDTPKIRPMFALTDPTALPTARPMLPSAAPIVETKISGRVVAIETIVAPIIKRGTPLTSAIQLDASTNQSPPLTIRTIPTASNKIQINHSI